MKLLLFAFLLCLAARGIFLASLPSCRRVVLLSLGRRVIVVVIVVIVLFFGILLFIIVLVVAVVWTSLPGVPAYCEGHEAVSDAATHLVVVLHQQLEHVLVIVLIVVIHQLSGFLQVDIIRDMSTFFQVAKEATEEGVPGFLLLLALLLGLLGTSTLDLLGHLFHGHILPRFPLNDGGLDLFGTHLPCVRVLFLHIVLLGQLGVGEVRVLHKVEMQSEALGQVRLVKPGLGDIFAVLQHRLIPLLDMVFKCRQILHGLLPKILQGRSSFVFGLLWCCFQALQYLCPGIQERLLLLGILLLQLLHGFLVFLLDGQVLVVQILQLLDQRFVFLLVICVILFWLKLWA
mmetsp:Transcript_53816/g.109453  ORF Transcript_53816/g.109453 Transcript_53816/m.109453 type:complete len:345 (+) Transcript_53816:129-1163(+)